MKIKSVNMCETCRTVPGHAAGAQHLLVSTPAQGPAGRDGVPRGHQTPCCVPVTCAAGTSQGHSAAHDAFSDLPRLLCLRANPTEQARAP